MLSIHGWTLIKISNYFPINFLLGNSKNMTRFDSLGLPSLSVQSNMPMLSPLLSCIRRSAFSCPIIKRIHMNWTSFKRSPVWWPYCRFNCNLRMWYTAKFDNTVTFTKQSLLLKGHVFWSCHRKFHIYEFNLFLRGN
jgi:hypothetical protein